MEFQDSLPLPIFKPMISWNQSVVLVGLAVTPTPIVILARRNPQPADQLLRRNLRSLVPTTHAIDHFIAGVMGNPASFQSSPLAFFERTFSSINSEMTSFFCCNLVSKRAIFSSCTDSFLAW